MSKFTTPLVVSPQSDGRSWILWEDFTYHVGEYPSNFVVWVPKGFRTDFASVPRPFWGLISPYGKQGKAAVLHDWLYHMGRTEILNPEITRKEADGIFLEAMQVLGVSRWRRQAMYWAVRLFAGRAWRR